MTRDREDDDLSAAIKAGATRHPAPDELRAAIRGDVARAAAAIGHAPAANRRPIPIGAWLKLGAAFACGVVLSFLLVQQGVLLRTTNPLAEQVVAAHVRSMMVAHLEDVASTDQHTVKPWFGGKLDYSPPVSDFAGQGFALSGGRLDYIGQRPVAALVYRRRGHVINVFVWPLRGEAQSLVSERDGYNLIALSGAGMQYWIVSDLNGDELRQFAALLHDEGGKKMEPRPVKRRPPSGEN